MVIVADCLLRLRLIVTPNVMFDLSHEAPVAVGMSAPRSLEVVFASEERPETRKPSAIVVILAEALLPVPSSFARSRRFGEGYVYLAFSQSLDHFRRQAPRP